MAIEVTDWKRRTVDWWTRAPYLDKETLKVEKSEDGTVVATIADRSGCDTLTLSFKDSTVFVERNPIVG